MFYEVHVVVFVKLLFGRDENELKKAGGSQSMDQIVMQSPPLRLDDVLQPLISPAPPPPISCQYSLTRGPHLHIPHIAHNNLQGKRSPHSVSPVFHLKRGEDLEMAARRHASLRDRRSSSSAAFRRLLVN